MKIVVIGATGTIGKAVADALARRHTVVRVGHMKGDHLVDLVSPDSIRKLLCAVSPFDAVVCAAGLAKFGPLTELTDADFQTEPFQ